MKMNEFKELFNFSDKNNYQIKKNKYFDLLIFIPAILCVVAEYLAVVSSYANETYAITALYAVMVMSEIALALLIAVFFIGLYFKGQIVMLILDAVRIVAVVLLCVCFFIVLDERATLMGYVWFSDLESGNANSVNALNYGVGSAVVYAIAALATAATGAVEFVFAKRIPRTREMVQGEIAELEKELAKLNDSPADGSNAGGGEELAKPDLSV